MTKPPHHKIDEPYSDMDIIVINLWKDTNRNLQKIADYLEKIYNGMG